MTPEIERLRVTLSLVEKEAHYLRDVTQRLFPGNAHWDAHRLQQHLATPEGIDQIESFGAKFGRLQDTLVDKLFPRYLEALGERKGPAIDTLNRLAAFGLIEDSAAWLAMRRLRNRLVHEYVEDMDELATALNAAREAVERLLDAVSQLKTDIQTRWPGKTA